MNLIGLTVTIIFYLIACYFFYKYGIDIKFTILLIIILILSFIALLSGCFQGSKNPIVGRWKSDKAETLKEIRNSGSLTDKQIEILMSKVKFGKLILEIDANEITSYYEDDVDTESYKLINIDGQFVEIESNNPLTNELERIVIEVRDEKMWVPSTLVEFREVFVKIK